MRRRRLLGVMGALAMAAGMVAVPPKAAVAAEPTFRVATVPYCVAYRGTTPTAHPEFAPTVQQILNALPGWSLGGTLVFRRVSSGCPLTVWLARNDLVPSFGGACTTFYSCNTPGRVIINVDRWTYGSPYWPGSVGNYRRLVVNHETGHWLGLNHVGCPAPGAPAPIMMQQSKGLGGCRASYWPTDSERRAVAAARGLRVVPVPTNGWMLKVPGQPLIRLLDQGRLRAVPDLATMLARGGSARLRYVPYTVPPRFPTGRAVPSVRLPNTADGILLTASGTPVFVMEGGYRRGIPSPTVFNAHGFYWSDIRRVSLSVLAAIPVGPTLR